MKSRVHFYAKIAVTILLAAILALPLMFKLEITRCLDSVLHKTEKLVMDRLHREGVVLYAPFDEPNPLNYCTHIPLYSHGMRSTDGVHGRARSFTPDNESFFVCSDVEWRNFDEGGSLAFWMKTANAQRRQRIIWDTSINGGFGVVVHDGLVSFVTFDWVEEKTLVSAPVNGNEFTHIAITSGEGAISIFRNGRKIDSAAIDGLLPIPKHPISVGSVDRTAVCHEPIDMVLDDFLVLRRTLSDHEVAEIAEASTNAGCCLSRAESAVHSLCRAIYRSFQSYFGVVADLSSLFVTPARLNTSIPSAVLQMSANEERKLKRGFANSVESGYRVDRRVRDVSLIFAGSKIHAKIALYDSFSNCDGVSRPAFIIEGPESVFGAGNNVFKLFPPEMYGLIHPEQEFPLPLNPFLTRLELNGTFLGLYVVEPFGINGSAWQMVGRISNKHIKMLHLDDPVHVWGKSRKEAEEEYWRVARLLRSDALFPWGMHDVQRHLDLFSQKRGEQGFGPICRGPSEDDFLGGNPASMYIVEDLMLPEGVICESSDIGVIDNNGKVTRPTEGKPVNVCLSVTGAFGKRDLKFRVMPDNPLIPAYFLHFGSLLEKPWRTDFTCKMIPSDGSDSEWIVAIGKKCGARHRGHTSYLRSRRRSLSLAFPRPLKGDRSPANHLSLNSGHKEPTKLRNKLSYDIFRAMGTGSGSRHVAPEVMWAELFVNGRYFGVYEMSNRIQDLCDEGDSLFKARWQIPKLWRVVSANTVDFVGDIGDGSEDHYRDFLAINYGIANSSGPALAEFLHNGFDIGNLVDFFLLLNFTVNTDGEYNNHYICRGAADGKWYLAPWDYDHAFWKGNGSRSKELGNRLLRSLVDAVGRDAINVRWGELRRSVLTDEFFEEWFDNNVAVLSPYMDDEYNLLMPLGSDGTFQKDVANLENEVHARLKWMDEQYIK